MIVLFRQNKKLIYQVFLAAFFVLVVSIGSYFSTAFLGYKVVALLLLMTVSILAMLLDIIPVLIAASLSALIWNYFFIPPVFTFHIYNPEDVLMFVLYFFIALVNTVLTFKIKRSEKKLRDKEEKEKAIKLYNTLLNSLSHELRTPIATIIGSVDTLKDGKDKISEVNQFELLNQIVIAGFKLNHQVENLLNMSRLESGMLQLKREWCDVNELVHLIIQNHFDANPRIVFNEEADFPICRLDIGVVEQILINLISNALLYTPIEEHVTIKISIENGALVCEVIDNGAGVPEENLKQIFDKFYRVPNTITGGTGLGLSIVKGFVEAHEGTVNVKNRVPNGLNFVIIIPVEMSYVNNLKNE